MCRASGASSTWHEAYVLLNLIEFVSREELPRPLSLRYTLENIEPEFCFSVARFYPADLRRIRQLLHPSILAIVLGISEHI